MSNEVIYSLYIERGDLVASGLDPVPVFSSFINVGDGTDLAEQQEVLPLINELSDGFYKFTIDWASNTFNGAGYLVKVDCGDSFVDPKQRYITMRLDRQDNVFNVVEDINTASETINTASAELLRFIKRLLEVENGTWEIAGGQLLIKSTGQYETETVADTIIGSWNLLDQNGITNVLNPFKRVYFETLPIPNGD
tara:strand:- start:877 stop:1461 length:585 start_codon:yes stop_codon:yes gene_type:complete